MTAGIQLGVNLSELPTPPQNFFSLGAYGEEIVIKDSTDHKIILGEAATPGYGSTSAPGLIQLAENYEVYDDNITDRAIKPDQMPLIINYHNRLTTKYGKAYVGGNHSIVIANPYSYATAANAVFISGQPSPAAINQNNSVLIGNRIYDGLFGTAPIGIGYGVYSKGVDSVAIGGTAYAYYGWVVLGSNIGGSGYTTLQVGTNGDVVMMIDSYNVFSVNGINLLGAVEAVPTVPTHKVLIDTGSGNRYLLLATV